MGRSLAAPFAVSNLVVAIVCMVLPSGARAEGRTSFSVTFDAPESCPSKRDFVSEIQRRSKKAVPVGPAESPAVVVSVRIDPKKRPFVGRLELTAGVSFKERTVTDRRCADVVSAIALVTALAIDPEAETRPLASLPDAPPAPPLPPGPPMTSGPDPVAPPMGPVPSRVWVAPVATGPLGVEWLAPPLPAWIVRPPPVRDRWGFEASAAAALSIGLYDQPLVGVRILSGLRHATSPSFNIDLGFNYLVQTGQLRAFGLDAGLSLATGELRMCGPDWIPTIPLRLSPCASFEAGAMLVTLTNSANATTNGVGPFVALGVGGRGQWLWTRGLGLQAEIDLTLPATQPEFRNGGRTVVDGRPVAFDAALGVFLNLP
jgi:hypothetical protein